MDAIYNTLAATATKMIKQYGQSVTWRTLRDTAPADPTKPWIENTFTAVNYIVKMAFFPLNRLFFESQHLIRVEKSREDFTEQTAGQVQGYMAPQVFIPSIKDIVIKGSVEHRIVSVTEYNPAGKVLLYVIEFEM